MSEPKQWSMAIGQNTGTCFQIVEGLVPAMMMLPPCSSDDLPIWIHVIEKSAYDSLKSKYEELLSYLPKVPTEPTTGILIQKLNEDTVYVSRSALQKLAEENKRLREALEFYADETKEVFVTEKTEDGWVQIGNGEIARKALEETK